MPWAHVDVVPAGLNATWLSLALGWTSINCAMNDPLCVWLAAVPMVRVAREATIEPENGVPRVTGAVPRYSTKKREASVPLASVGRYTKLEAM